MKPTAPLYQNVYDQIIGRIISGDLGPGAMLPSEKDLGLEYGVSQGTARKALSELELKGIVLRRQGLGTFVATTTPESDLFHFFRLRKTDGSHVTPEMAEETIKKRAATVSERSALTVCGDDVFEIRRIRTENEAVVVFEKIVLPAVLFPGLEERGTLPNTLYAMFQRSYGIAIVKAEEKLRAVRPSRQEARKLAQNFDEPLLEVQRMAIDLSERVVELRFSRYVTQNSYYEISLD